MKFLNALTRFFTVDNSARRLRRQGGYVVISLAAIGLFGGAAAAVPVLNRVLGSLNASDSTPANQSGASCAAEHALWRLQNDPGIWSSMSGSPPSTNYQHPACGVLSDADITITALSDPPTGDDRFEVTVEAAPDVVDIDDDVQFTFTMKFTNNDIVPHDITRVVIDPKWFFAPDLVSGSTTGITTNDPIVDSGCFLGICWTKFTWDIFPYVQVEPFGGEKVLAVTVSDNRSAGSHYTGGSVRLDGEGTMVAPNSARVRFMEENDLLVEQFVSPSINSAGRDTTYDFILRATNVGSSDITLEWLRAWMHPDLSYVFGSSELWQGSSQSSFADPDINYGGWFFDFLSEYVALESRTRYQWDVPPTTINPGSHVDLTYQMQATLEPGIFYSRGSGWISEQPGGFWALLELSTSTTGETAPIEVFQGFLITAVHEGVTVEVEGTITATGVDVLSWKEF